jgi:hypothetical protein
MRKELIFAFAAFFYMSLHAIAGSFAEEQKMEEGKEMVIHTYNVDVTGDDKKDVIELKGIPYSSDTKFLKEIWAEIKTSEGKQFRIDYEGGYEPKIQFVDLNHDGVKDLLESSATGGSGGLYNTALHTLADDKLVDIGLPDELTIQAQFQDDYKAVIKFTDTNQSYTVDLKDRKKDYDRLGLYIDGKLNEPTELMILPYAFFEPVKIADKKGKGLKATQRISGAYHADAIGDVFSYWYYENNKWNLMKIEWKELKEQNGGNKNNN